MKKIKLRVIIQLVIFALVLLIAINHSLEESGGGIPFLSSASLHAVCPFGGVVSIHTLVTSGTFVKKIHESSMVLMFVVFAVAIFLGPVFCGWICPFGTFQEWVGRLGKKIFKKRYNKLIPYKIDRVLRFLRYLLLFMVLVNTARSAQLMFANIDPYYALFNFWTGEVAITAYAILAIVFLLSLIVERPFCKYACPYGAVLGLTNLFRFIPLRRNKKTCIDCGACDRACPMNIPVSTSGVVRNHQCISCFECTSDDGKCPVPDTLSFTTKFKEVQDDRSSTDRSRHSLGNRIIKMIPFHSLRLRMKIRAQHAGFTILLLFIVAIGFSMVIGYWETESSKEPVKFDKGNFAGEYNPADIRGSYSFEDIETAFDIPVETLAKAYGFAEEENPGAIQIKIFEEIYTTVDDMEVGTDSMRLFVALYLGLPYVPETTTAIPQPAWSILKKEAAATAEVLDGFSDRVISFEDVKILSADEVADHEESDELDTTIKGKTTFGDLLNWGLTQGQIEEIIDGEMGGRAVTVRDYCMEKGVEFSIAKEALQPLVDGL